LRRIASLGVFPKRNAPSRAVIRQAASSFSQLPLRMRERRSLEGGDGLFASEDAAEAFDPLSRSTRLVFLVERPVVSLDLLRVGFA
jgi:hypothetical protein